MKKLLVPVIALGVFIALGWCFSFFPNTTKLLEYISGIVTLATCCYIVWISIKFWEKIPKLINISNIAAATTLGFMYFLWLTFNYGAASPDLSAFGFNVAEILRNFTIICFIELYMMTHKYVK